MSHTILSWEDRNEIITNLAEIHEFLREIEREALDIQIPIAVELVVGPQILLVTIGGSRSMIVYTPDKTRFEYVLSGNEIDPVFEYIYHGSHTEVDWNRTVPIEDALNALFQFYTQATKPLSLPWE